MDPWDLSYCLHYRVPLPITTIPFPLQRSLSWDDAHSGKRIQTSSRNYKTNNSTILWGKDFIQNISMLPRRREDGDSSQCLHLCSTLQNSNFGSNNSLIEQGRLVHMKDATFHIDICLAYRRISQVHCRYEQPQLQISDVPLIEIYRAVTSGSVHTVAKH